MLAYIRIQHWSLNPTCFWVVVNREHKPTKKQVFVGGGAENTCVFDIIYIYVCVCVCITNKHSFFKLGCNNLLLSNCI
jgi:hypothetical protein